MLPRSSRRPSASAMGSAPHFTRSPRVRTGTCTRAAPSAPVAFFSDFGARIDLAAPGCAIVSTVPPQATVVSQNRPNPLADAMSGTSQAAPMVSGVAALLFSLYPQASATQVAAALCAGVRPEPALVGLTRCGGMFDAVVAARALAAALGAPPPQVP
jgi:serine protease